MQEQRIKAAFIGQRTPGSRIKVSGMDGPSAGLLLSRRTPGGRKSRRGSLIHLLLMAVLLWWVKISVCWRGFREDFCKGGKTLSDPVCWAARVKFRIELVCFADVGSEIDTRIFLSSRPLCSNWKLSVEAFRWRERHQLKPPWSLLHPKWTCVIWELWPGSVTHGIPAYWVSVSQQD